MGDDLNRDDERDDVGPLDDETDSRDRLCERAKARRLADLEYAMDADWK